MTAVWAIGDIIARNSTPYRDFCSLGLIDSAMPAIKAIDATRGLDRAQVGNRCGASKKCWPVPLASLRQAEDQAGSPLSSSAASQTLTARRPARTSSGVESTGVTS
jgi:hypothetical protein